ncbi:MAG: winged helix-turn-helix domain-containing protein [Armatimonadota bacterium]
MMSRVLVATDQPKARDRLRRALEAEDVVVLGASTADDVLAILDSHELDLILIHAGLPGLPSHELADICSQRTGALVLVVDMRIAQAMRPTETPGLSRERQLEDRAAAGSGVGALRMIDVHDDYNTSGRMRRSSHCLSSGDLTLWLDQNTVTVGERDTPLKPVEARILRELLEHAPRVVPPELLIARVWPDGEGDLSALATAISSLRAALGDDPLNPSRIQHVERFGYKITPQRSE